MHQTPFFYLPVKCFHFLTRYGPVLYPPYIFYKLLKNHTKPISNIIWFSILIKTVVSMAIKTKCNRIHMPIKTYNFRECLFENKLLL